MSRGRLEAFSDGVMAVLITIMVLELHIPEGNGLEALRAVLPQFLFYVMSFIYLGIYWSNHHHLLHTVSTVNGKILWANLHLLFWLSLFPVTTAWMGENHLAVIPTATYGVVMICAAIAYTILVRTIIATHGRQSTLATAVGRDSKDKLSIVIYGVAILMAFVSPIVSAALYATVAVMWLVPDRRIERTIRSANP